MTVVVERIARVVDKISSSQIARNQLWMVVVVAGVQDDDFPGLAGQPEILHLSGQHLGVGQAVCGLDGSVFNQVQRLGNAAGQTTAFSPLVTRTTLRLWLRLWWPQHR